MDCNLKIEIKKKKVKPSGKFEVLIGWEKIEIVLLP